MIQNCHPSSIFSTRFLLIRCKMENDLRFSFSADYADVRGYVLCDYQHDLQKNKYSNFQLISQSFSIFSVNYKCYGKNYYCFDPLSIIRTI